MRAGLTGQVGPRCLLRRSVQPLRSECNGVRNLSPHSDTHIYSPILRIDESVAYKDSKVVNRLPNALAIGSKI